MFSRWIPRLACVALVTSFLPACTPGAGSTAPVRTPSKVNVVSDPLEFEWGDPTLYDAGLSEGERSSQVLLKTATEYHLDLVLDDDLHGLTGRVAIKFTNPVLDPLTSVYLRLYPNISGGKLELSDISIDSTPVNGSLESDLSVYKVPLPHTLDPGETVILEMSLKLLLPLEMAGNYGLFGFHNGILLLQEFMPLLSVVDGDGWALETPPPHGDLTHLAASFFLVQVRAPSDLILASSGTTLQVSTTGEYQTILASAGPARDFYIAASSDFTLASLEADGVMIRNFAVDPDLETSDEMLHIAASAISIFNEYFGPYPYNEFDMIGIPMQALGMEYPGIIALVNSLYNPQATISGFPSSYYLEATVVHEVAHQWFYNLIGNDQVLDPWLDEALAQFATGLYFREQYGQDAYLQFRDSWLSRWDQVDKLAIPIGKSSAGYTSKEYGPIIYGRGPLFIEQLELSMGEEPFSDFLHSYGTSLRWEISTPATFQQLAESACSCNLEPLFEAWVFDG